MNGIAVVRLDSLRRDQRFLVAEGDAIVYRYLWPSVAAGGVVTVADHRGTWLVMGGELEVIPVYGSVPVAVEDDLEMARRRS